MGAGGIAFIFIYLFSFNSVGGGDAGGKNSTLDDQTKVSFEF